MYLVVQARGIQAAVPKILLCCGFAVIRPLYFMLYISLQSIVFGPYLVALVGCKYFIAII
jgi:hypothetical protein